MELLTAAELARADEMTIAGGLSGFALMERAGIAVADCAAAMMAGPGARVLVVAGPGKNGGDGFVAAAELAGRGIDVTVALLGRADALSGDTAQAARQWSGPVIPASPGLVDGTDLIVDALYGAGLNRDVGGEAAKIVTAINASGAPVLSVDLPSGINGTTGAVMGCAVRATETVTFFRKKPGHLLLPGRVHCRRVEVADIGIDASVLAAIAPKTSENGPDLWHDLFPRPAIDGHKYSRGHVVVASGAMASSGAARLAARGALRVGAGLVTVASPPDALAVNAAALTAIMVRQVDGAAEFEAVLADRRINACVIGPGNGVGETTRAMALASIRAGRATVLDADALTSFADDPTMMFSAIKLSATGKTVLTPHSGRILQAFRGYDSKISTSLKA